MLVTGTFDTFIIHDFQKYELKYSVLCNVPTNEDITFNGHLSEIALCPFLEIVCFLFFCFLKDLLFLHQCIYNIIIERTYRIK